MGRYANDSRSILPQRSGTDFADDTRELDTLSARHVERPPGARCTEETKFPTRPRCTVRESRNRLIASAWDDAHGNDKLSRLPIAIHAVPKA